jgi:hypothetical protein
LFERTAQKEKNSSKIITQDIRRRKNLPFLDIIPTAPEKTQVQREKEGAFIRNGRENQSRKTKKPRRLDLPRSTLPRISCRRQEGEDFSEGGFSPAVILSGAKDLGLSFACLPERMRGSAFEVSFFAINQSQKRDPSGGEAHPQDDSVAVRASPKGRNLGFALACHPEERSDEGSRG